MAGLEAQQFVEAMLALAAVVGGQLHGTAASFAGTVDGMADQLRAEPLSAQMAGDAHRLDLRAPPALLAESGKDHQLQAADDRPLPVQSEDHLAADLPHRLDCLAGALRQPLAV